MSLLYEELTYKIIGCALEVHKELGSGFLEKVYENALMVSLIEKGVHVKQQNPVKVKFKGRIVGEYVSDILVEEKVILELKAGDKLSNIHRAQVLNYLKSTNLRLAILLNFKNQKLEYERFIK